MMVAIPELDGSTVPMVYGGRPGAPGSTCTGCARACTFDPAGSDPKPDRRRLRPPGLLELEELLSARLDTRVKVEMGAKKGKMHIEFANLEDLERIYRIIDTSS